MNKVRNKRDNAWKVVSKQLTQSKQSVDGELGTLASWTGHQGRHNIGPCSVNPHGPLGWVSPALPLEGPGLPPGTSMVGRRSSYEQEN